MVKQCQAWFCIDCNQSLQPKRSQMTCYVWKPRNDQPWQDELRFWIWRFYEHSAFVNNHLLCYWPTIHNSISKICPKFQVLSSHFFEDSMSSEQKLCKVKIFQVQSESMLNVMTYIDKRFRSRILVYRVWPWYSTWTIRERPSCQQKNWLQVERLDEKYTVFSMNWYEPMAQWFKWVVQSRATLVRFPQDRRRLLKVSAAPLPCCVALNPSMHWHSMIFKFSFLDFVSAISRWQSCKS